MADQTKIALGIFASCGVVLLSYLLVKKFGPRKKDDFVETDSGHGDGASVLQKKAQEKEPTEESRSDVKADVPVVHGELAAMPKTNNVDNTSEEKELVTDDGKSNSDSGKANSDSGKADSDDSFDVIDNEVPSQDDNKDDFKHDEVIDEKGPINSDDNCQKDAQEAVEESIDSSMVVVEDVLEKSGNSFYTSAEEVLNESVDKLDQSVEFIKEEKAGQLDESVEFIGEEHPDGLNNSEDTFLGKSGEVSSASICDESVESQQPGDSSAEKSVADRTLSAAEADHSLGETTKAAETSDVRDDEGNKYVETAAGGIEKDDTKDGNGVENEEVAAVDVNQEVLDERVSAEVNGEAEGMSGSMSSWVNVEEERNGLESGEPQPTEDDHKSTAELPITSAVLTSDLNVGQQESNAAANQEQITEVLSVCQSSPAEVTREHMSVLHDILTSQDASLASLIPVALDSLVRVSAFTQNNVNLRDSGCPQAVTSLTKVKCSDVVRGDAGSETLLLALCQVITNFSMDPKTQVLMEDCVPALLGVLSLESSNEGLQFAVLRPLTNFSTEPSYQQQYCAAVPSLFEMVDSGSPTLRLQVLKVLVNISLYPDMLPHLLAAKAPTCLLDLLDLPTSTDVILRTVTFLANVEERLLEDPRAPLAMPVEEKAESTHTLHISLRGVDNVPNLRNKVFRLTRHEDEDVVFQASRLYKTITAPQK